MSGAGALRAPAPPRPRPRLRSSAVRYVARVPGESDAVIGLWEDGRRRLADVSPSERPAVDRVVDELVLELRRRLGGPFTSDELAQLYLDEGTDWCLEIAMRTAPTTPDAWDMTTVAGAAFARYLRSAIDFGGGRRREPDA
jgi:hypothetical protein